MLDKIKKAFRSLKDEIQTLLDEQFMKQPKEAIDANLNQIKQLKAENAGGDALKTPASAPDFTLPSYAGHDISLDELRKRGPVILSFYRGRWCPFCNLELKALKRALDEFKEQGATLVAISPMTIEQVKASSEGSSPDFEVASDLGNNVARQFGLVFTMNDELSGAFDAFGLHLKEYNGDDANQLPIPATYVIAPDGKIAFSFVDPDWTKRAEPADVLAALKSLNAQN